MIVITTGPALNWLQL